MQLSSTAFFIHVTFVVLLGNLFCMNLGGGVGGDRVDKALKFDLVFHLGLF